MSCRSWLATVTTALAAGFVPAAADEPQALPPPRTVTLQEKVRLSTALKRLSEQTRIPVELKTKADPEVDARLKEVPFWQALDELARQAGARVHLHQPGGRIALVDGPAGSRPVCYTGPFRLAVSRVAAVRDLETGAHFYTVSVEVAWEPHLQPFLLQTRPAALVVEDEQKRQLQIQSGGSVKEAIDGKIAAVIDLRVPALGADGKPNLDRSVNKLGLLKGNLSLIAPTKMLTFTFDPLSKTEGQQQTKDGVRVTVAKVTLDQTRWTVQVELNYPPGGPEFESFRSWLVNNEIYLEKAGGPRFPNNANYRIDLQKEAKALVSYHFVDEPKKDLLRGKPGDWKLVYVTPAKIVEMTVPFEFKDVPLP